MSVDFNQVFDVLKKNKVYSSGEGALGDVKFDEMKPENDTPQNPDGKIPVVVFEGFPMQYKPQTVSQVLGMFMQFQDDPLLQVLDFLRESGIKPESFKSLTLRILSDIDLLMEKIPEDKRVEVMDYWNMNYSKFPGFANYGVMEEWIKTRGDRFLFFLLQQVIRFSQEKKNPESRTS